MRKLIFKIEDNTSSKQIEFITDRTPEWTEEQYTRNREPLTMELISNEATKETKAVSREI
jgi:hypothetical protein|tara:strand:+ start:183 stop:362 length:180 start_codon:yes stop_codon:yes gene_type:complete